MKIEDLFLSSLGKPQKLKWYLQHDINLINYLNSTWPKLMFLATTTTSLIPKNKLIAEIGSIDPRRILRLIERERPDLYKLIDTERGLIWLDREIQNFKDYFLK